MGGFQAYTSPPVAVSVVVVGLPALHTLRVPPIKAVGNGLTVAIVLAVAAQLAALVTVTVYVPLAAVVAAAMLGVALVEVNPFGPDQLYVPPPVAVKFKAEPTHIGLLLLAVATGKALIVTVVEVVAVQPLEVTVTV